MKTTKLSAKTKIVHADAGLLPAPFKPSRSGPALSVEMVLQGRLRSDTDRKRSDSTGRILAHPSFQLSLAELSRTLRASGASEGEWRLVNGVHYRSLFESDWKVEVKVKFLIGVRPRCQQPDLDNLWKPLQNAMAFPPPRLAVPVKSGSQLFTLFASDRQVTSFAVSMAPFAAVAASEDLTVLQVTAYPAPGLALVRAA